MSNENIIFCINLYIFLEHQRNLFKINNKERKTADRADWQKNKLNELSTSHLYWKMASKLRNKKFTKKETRDCANAWQLYWEHKYLPNFLSGTTVRTLNKKYPGYWGLINKAIKNGELPSHRSFVFHHTYRTDIGDDYRKSIKGLMFDDDIKALKNTDKDINAIIEDYTQPFLEQCKNLPIYKCLKKSGRL